MEAPANAPPASGPTCPGCGKAVDSLRAGHVSLVDTGFLYFHDAACKAAYGEASSRRVSMEAMTKDPPPVASRTRPREPAATVVDRVEAEEPVAPTLRTPAPTPAATPRPAPRAPTPAPAPVRIVPEVRVRAEVRDAPVSSAPPPATLRSPATLAVVDRTSAPLSRTAALAAPIGIAAGVLAPAVALGGEVLAAARPPLALLAAILAAIRLGIGPARAAPSVLPRATYAPIAVAALVMLVAPLVPGTAPATGFATFVGVASAALLGAEMVIVRARRSSDDARERMRAALDVTARVVRRERRDGPWGDVLEDVPAAHVKPGDAFVVEAGEVVAADGVVAAGVAELGPWPGAASSIEKREGDLVVAGATLVTGRLRVTASFTGADRAFARAVDAPGARADLSAPLLLLARRALLPGAPAAGVVAALATWANTGIVLDALLAGCAAAFALGAEAGLAAAGVAFARAQLAAAARGVVYKDGARFELAGRVDVAVVCSRGTILLGEPEIVAVEAVGARGADGDADDAKRVLALAAGAEMGSTHPFAQAVTRAAKSRGVTPEPVRSAIGHSGLGVSALVASGEKVVVGSRAFLLSEKTSVAVADARVSELEAQGRSVLLVALAGRLVGLLALQDGLRPGARAAVQRLHDAHIEPVLLSGEARETCETIARALEIDHVRPEVLPADRGAEVIALAEGGHVVAAVGHPSSDDGALGAAELAVAMASAGAAPGEWGVALASDDVRDAAMALALPRASRDRARVALVVAGVAQGLLVLALAFGVAPPPAAAVVGFAAAIAAVSLVRDGG